MSEDKTFYVWNENTKQYCKAIWDKDLPDGGSFSSESKDSLPRKQGYNKLLWVFDEPLNLREKWWIEDPQWWKKNNIVIPPEEPPSLKPGFWCWKNAISEFRWIRIEGKDKYSSFCENGIMMSYKRDLPYFESVGYILPPNIKEGKEVEKTAQQLQNDLIEYCAKKNSRISHLQELTRLGALDPNISYGKLAQTITDYLDNTNGICSEGRVKAKTALGLEKKVVVKQLTCSEILDGIKQGKNYYFVDKQGRKVTTEHKSNHYMYIPKDWLGSINYGTVLTVGVEE